jgi:integrase/recombinase XerD
MGKLRDRMQEDLILKAYSPHTREKYLQVCRPFCKALHEVPGRDGGDTRDPRVSPPSRSGPEILTLFTQGTYVSAIKFLYTVTLKRPEVVKDISYPKRPIKLPVILSPQEVLSVFEKVRSVNTTALQDSPSGKSFLISLRSRRTYQ